MLLNSRSFVVLLTSALLVAIEHFAQAGDARPNILWLSAEDISPHLGCYGDPHAITPNLDSLASEAVRYTHAFTTAGVCAPCRSGIITGMYQTTLGTHHMRCQVSLPEHIKPFPYYLREAGYYATNNSKEDYQFVTPVGTWDESSPEAHWRNRRRDQPFFAVFNYRGCHESGIVRDAKYRSVTSQLTPQQRQNAEMLTTLPPYYPDTPAVREDWKRYYELITAMDAWAGGLIQQLKDGGLYEETIIMFWSDHGVGLPRAKRWLYDSGTRIPLIVRVPEKFRIPGQAKPGSVEDELISSIDFGMTVLNLAGLDIPDHCQGQPFLGANIPAPRAYVFGARDRMDERYDIIRMVRDKRFKYLRNYVPFKEYYQHMETPEKGITMKELRRLHELGQLPADAERYFSPSKSEEELYDTLVDPHELNNLADDPRFKEKLTCLRNEHLAWVERTKDLGLIPEPILAAREKKIGHQYWILRQAGGDELAKRLIRTASLTSEGESALDQLLVATQDADAAVRYWGVVGLGNLDIDSSSVNGTLQNLLEDRSAAVRIAAAYALCRQGVSEPALSVLASSLHQGDQWARLLAAIMLDQLDEKAVPEINVLRDALEPPPSLFAKGKYIVRVIKHALQELETPNSQEP